ncbi:MAG: GyrI-like domain-containing protein [Chitinophagaceae bacterium]
MKPRIETLIQKKLVGKRMTMSFSDNKTAALWKSFMEDRKEIKKSIGPRLYSVQIYSPQFFEIFNPNKTFEKWAATEVTDFDAIPNGMEAFNLVSGLYAVFLHKGGPDTAVNTFQYILGTWLPNSEYALDNRPHFEMLGEKYKNNEPDSEEEIWMPIKPKG